MKGLIFSAVRGAVVELYDEETWDTLLNEAGVSGVYTSLGTYEDAELLNLVQTACRLTGQTSDDLLRVIGRKAIPTLAHYVSDLINKDQHVFDFLSTVDEIIHLEVKKLAADASPPEVSGERVDEHTLRVKYTSHRNLPSLAEGLILGAGDLFGQELSVAKESQTGNTTTFVVKTV